MINEKIEIERSPFYVERDEKTQKGKRKSVRTDVSPEVYQDIEKYITQRGDDFDRSKFVKELVMDFLNNHALEQKFFRHLNAILLLPKTSNPEEINGKAKVISFIEGNDWLELTLLNIFHGVIDYPLRNNFIYTLKEFNRENYNAFLYYFQGLYGYEENIFFNVDKETQKDFDKVKTRLSEDIDFDIDDAYFVMFTFNNYLDVLIDGVYKSRHDKYEHDGVVVLMEDLKEGVFASIIWKYLEGEFVFSLEFFDINEFESQVGHKLTNPEILEDIRNMSKMVNSKDKLKYDKKETIREIDNLDLKINVLKSKRERCVQKLKRFDEELSQYDEDAS